MIDSSQTSLDQIQKHVYRLCTNRRERADFFSAKSAESELTVSPEIVRIYSSLLQIGQVDLMSSIYPVTNKLLGKNFENLVFDYFESTPADHFNLNRSAARFSQYLAKCEKLLQRYPFLPELADYEWIELAVMEDPSADVLPQEKIADASNNEVVAAAVQFAALRPVIVGATICRQYKYDIGKIVQSIEDGKKIARTIKPVNYCVVLYRDPQSLEVRFLEVGETALKLLQAIQTEPDTTYGDLLKNICSQDPAHAQKLLTGCLEAIDQFKALKLIIAEH